MYAVLVGVGTAAMLGLRSGRVTPPVPAICAAAIPFLVLDGWVLVEAPMLGRYPFTLF